MGSTETEPTKPPAELDQLVMGGAKAETVDVIHARVKGTEWVYRTPIMLDKLVLGTLYMGVTTGALDQELTASLAQSQARAKATQNRVILVSIVVLAIGIVLAALQGVRLAG